MSEIGDVVSPFEFAPTYRFAVALMVAWFCGALADAAEISVGVSSRETYVGLPITLEIRIDNAEDHEPPEIPDVDGLTIESAGAASSSRQITIINGRRSERNSLAYRFRITPERAGTFTIPPIKVKSDGATEITRAIRFQASISETGDLLFVELSGNQESVYVGEAIDVTLKIWIRPFTDEEHGVTLSEGIMWSLLDEGQTNWGSFSERMEELISKRYRPRGEPVTREDGQGQRHRYYLYELETTIHPTRPGTLDRQDVRVVWRYPTGLGARRNRFDELFDSPLFGDPFRPRLAVTSVRPIVGEIEVEPITVKPIPDAGRPPDYKGAVGEYRVETEATPTRVKVGDPITLRMLIGGSGRMELVRAPPLDLQGDLVRDFRVTDQELAGRVSGRIKQFETTIRPRHEGVTQIPPIRFSYFDPERESFLTASSQPIEVQVEPAETLALDSIVAANSRAPRNGTEDPSRLQDITNEAAPVSGKQWLTNQTPAPFLSPLLQWALALPPVLCFLSWVLAPSGLVTQVVSRFRSPKRRFRRELDAADTYAAVALAFEHYLARRLPRSANKGRSAAIGQLRSSGQTDLAIRVERLYAQCQKGEAVAAVSGGASLEEVKRSANEIVDALHAWRRVKIRSKNVVTAGRAALGLALVLSLPTRETLSDDSAALSDEQLLTLLSEADALYEEALKSGRVEESELLAGQAAEKYQQVVDCGIANHQLFYQLANAHGKAKRYPQALANYRRALKLAPGNARYRAALANAESQGLSPGEQVGWRGTLRSINDQLWRTIPISVFVAVALVSWGGMWLAIALRGLGCRFAWKTMAVALLLLFGLTASSYVDAVGRFTIRDAAVLTAAEITVRKRDGSVITQWRDREGTVVPVLESRSGQLRIELAEGGTGWIEAAAAESI